MQYLEELIPSADEHEIPLRLWRPNQVDKILVIVHGMAEYCERYTPLADWLTEANVAVVSLNLRGHGMDCPDTDLGYFADSNGWQRLIDDIHRTIAFASNELPDIPITLYGHSMGSFLVQSYIQKHASGYEQVILGSSNRLDRPKLAVSYWLVNFLKAIKGSRKTSALVDWLSFGSFNRKFRPNRSDYDWLSRDDEQVDAYELDPYCGFSCTLSFWSDFIGGMRSIRYESWPADVKIHLLAGTDDPVGEFGEGVRKLASQICEKGRGLKTLKLYPQARHELVNEINSPEVWDDLLEITLHGSLSADH